MSENEDNKGVTADIPAEAVEQALQSVARRPAAGEKGEGTEIPVVVEGDEPDGRQQRGPSREELTAALEKSRAEAKAARERMLRALADVDNQRKRLARERQEIIKYGQEGLLRDLLVPLDNLERTLAHVPGDNDDPAVVALRDGLAMVIKQFEDALARHGLQPFSALGKPFDPQRHEALQQVEDAECEPGTVIGEIHRGYLLHDRLLRPALVNVACAPAAGAAAQDEAADSETETQQDE
ncbi:MAG: nucleotide exchange factor GrpE [Deltaproteobacteria bacterium]|nr:MAG: nucleotide exchange factor GrpE [Deltaproteobacteria bacterium]